MPELISRLPYEKYATIQAMNISKLKEMGRSPKHYRYRLDCPKKTEALRLGAAAHTAVLEPHRFLAEYALWDERSKSGRVRPRTGKDWLAFVASNIGKQIIKADEFYLAQSVRDAVRADPDAMRYIAKGSPEITMLWDDAETGRPCKGRVDWLTHVDGIDVLVGLKTARDCRELPFGNASARFGYHLQWAFYFDGYFGAKGIKARMVEIVVESAPPHDVATYVIPDEVVEAGRDEYRRYMVELIECESSKAWPGAVRGERILTLPSWVYRGEEELSELGLEAS